MTDSCPPSIVLDLHMIVEETIREWLVLHDFDSATPEEVKEEAAAIWGGLSRAIPTQVARQSQPDDVWRCRSHDERNLAVRLRLLKLGYHAEYEF